MKKWLMLLFALCLVVTTDSPANISKSRYFDFDYIVAFES